MSTPLHSGSLLATTLELPVRVNYRTSTTTGTYYNRHMSLGIIFYAPSGFQGLLKGSNNVNEV
jgi:hypothetical protein